MRGLEIQSAAISSHLNPNKESFVNRAKQLKLYCFDRPHYNIDLFVAIGWLGNIGGGDGARDIMASIFNDFDIIIF